MTRPTYSGTRSFPEWLSVLRTRLSMLKYQESLAFAASCCERLLPNYKAFAREVRWGNPTGLGQAVDLIWRLAGTESSAADAVIREAVKICDAAAPDTEKFSSVLTSAALDAASSIAETLEFAQDRNVEHLVTVSSLSRDTIDLYIQHRNNLDYSDGQFEDTIARDPLMVAEIEKEQRDLRRLESAQSLTPEFLASFRKEALLAGKSNLGLGSISETSISSNAGTDGT